MIQSASTYLTPPEVARRFAVSCDKVLRFIASGELRAVNLASKGSNRPRWKISEAALADFERARSAAPPPAQTPRRQRATDSECIHFFR